MEFKKWTPIDSLSQTLYLEGLYDDYEGFRLLLRGAGEEQRILRIAFDSALSYRNIDEGDSGFLQWFNHESQNIHKSDEVVHYSIYTPNDCLDVLSIFPPTVEWLN
nr:hypothetical protein [uncultured Desulfuromonas sp.]